MPKFLVLYTLGGGVEVEAATRREAQDLVIGDGEFEENPPMSDTKLLGGISRSHGYIDGDAIQIEGIEEIEEGR